MHICFWSHISNIGCSVFLSKFATFVLFLAPETRWGLTGLCIRRIMFIFSKSLTVVKEENSKNWMCTQGSHLHIMFPANKGLVLIKLIEPDSNLTPNLDSNSKTTLAVCFVFMKLSRGMLICKWERCDAKIAFLVTDALTFQLNNGCIRVFSPKIINWEWLPSRNG